MSRRGPYLPIEKVQEQCFKLEHFHAGEVYRVCFGSAFDDIAISAWQREHGVEKRRVAGQKALRDTEKLVLDLNKHKMVARNMKAGSRRVSEGQASIIGHGHEPGTLPFHLSSKNRHSGKEFVLSVRQAHHLCGHFRSWVAKESWVSILCGSDGSPHHS